MKRPTLPELKRKARATGRNLLNGMKGKGEQQVEVAAEAAGLNILWSVVRRLGIFGVGVAAAAVIGPNLIDLSNNNGAAAAKAIQAPGVQAVIAKATEGLGFHDQDYPVFRAAAAHSHRVFGGYLFLHPDESGKAQADYFLAYAQPRNGDLQPVVDSEIGSPCAAAPATLAALDELAAKGYQPILYSNTYWLGQFAHCAPALERFPVWEAEYGPVLNQIPGFQDIAWQFTDRASENGFSVDGSHLLVRSISQLEIRPQLTPAQKRARALAKRKTRLRTLTGYFAWYEWRHAVSRWKGLAPTEPDARPAVPRRIPDGWWVRNLVQWQPRS